jgi:hypothetical protein
MKPVVVVTIKGAEALPGGEGAFIEVETSEGPLELRCTYEDAERLIAALQSVRVKIQDARVHAGRPPLPENAKAADVWETAIDPVNQDALIRARYPDGTTQETRIPRNEVAAIARFLEQAARRFEVSAEMRQ